VEAIPFSSNTFDRVFCLSVVEHLSPDVARRGFREMARILKPGGRAIITADVNMFSEISRPLDLIWDSGLLPLGDMDLRWPTRRFGIFCDGKQPADVFGMTLIKEDYPVETQYSGVGGSTNPSLISASLIPTMRRQSTDGESARLRKTNRQIWRRGLCRVQKALGTIFQG
jgi:SAM-dependent methyltransferase